MNERTVDDGRTLEPRAGGIIHGAGQSDSEFASYCSALKHQPILYMTYVGLKRNMDDYFTRLAALLAQYPDSYLIPQIGLSMTRDGSPEEHYEQQVAAGAYDGQLLALCEGLKRLNRPVFLRIGYEFNGHWNGYEPGTYIQAWRRIVQALQDHGLHEVAAVWCYAPDDGQQDFMSFYPGDDHVDWWGIDCFDVSHFTAPQTLRFLACAAEHGYPVMIGESTPRHVGVLDGAESWNQWFSPYFQFMHDHPMVKAFCYISWDWSGYEQWKDWGDARIGANPQVRRLYDCELADPRYLHGGEESAVRRQLRLPALSGANPKAEATS